MKVSSGKLVAYKAFWVLQVPLRGGGVIGLIDPVTGLVVSTTGVFAGQYAGHVLKTNKVLFSVSGAKIPWLGKDNKKLQATKRQALKQYRQDLANSQVASPLIATHGRGRAREMAVLSGAIRQSYERLTKYNPIDNLPDEAWSGLISRNTFSELRSFGKLHVFLTSTAAAPIAIFLNNQAFLQENGLDIDINFNGPWGVDLMRKLEGSDDVHFVFSVDAPYFFATARGPRSYRHGITLHYEDNFLLRKRSKSQPPLRRIHTIEGSSAFEAARNRQDITTGLEARETNFIGIKGFAADLEKEEGLYVWSPLLSHDINSGGLVVERNSSYRSYRSILYHKSLYRQKKVIESFFLSLLLYGQKK